ncbi:MAG: hypothetical protein DMD60_01160 [Gemmatimonadetes bacterium]|nr:MAG: hypothetical protein DMD60_01160 [Gemmatimonadota bacterium]
MRLLSTVLRDASPRRLFVTPFVVLLLVGCSHRPPEDFAPDPGLVAQIRDIRIVTAYARACPGATIPATYEAVLTDGSRVPFSRSYDKKHPPRLHVVFLDRESPDAVSQEGGDWVAERDPLATVSTGFRLTATLRANSSIRNTIVVPPDYHCMPHTFVFSGEPGGAGEAGAPGPDATVRLGVLRSPFYDKLLVASIQVGLAQPFYVLQDASAVPPADWLVIESRGGRGGTGVTGTKGTDGSAGAAGCPAQAGAPGGNGGNGGAGGSGGHGGRVTVIVPLDNPFLAGIVAGRSPGGGGGSGGPGGAGGKGGKGGQGAPDATNRRCPDAVDGAPGQAGSAGPTGSEGGPGPRTIVVTAPAREIFGVQVPPELSSLLERLQRRP